MDPLQAKSSSETSDDITSSIVPPDDDTPMSTTVSSSEHTEESGVFRLHQARRVMRQTWEWLRPLITQFCIHSYQPAESNITVEHESNRITTDGLRCSDSINDSILMIVESPVVKKKEASSSNAPRRARRRFNIDFIEFDQTEENLLTASINSTELDFHGEKIDVNVDDLDDTRVIGSGNFGVVYEVTLRRETRTIRMALKCLEHRRDRHGYSSANNEWEILKTIGPDKNPHIIEYYGAMINSSINYMCIWMELMDTSVKNFYVTMHSLGEPPRAQLEFFIRRVAHHITSALWFLETKNLLHRDVKPANMLVNKENVVVKLCDFNICCRRSNSDLHQGSTHYQPPELKEAAIQNDMWALGISLLEIITNKHPFEDWPEDNNRYFKIILWERTVPEGISAPMRRLILHLLMNSADDRPSSYKDILDTLVEHDMISAPSDADNHFVSQVMINIPPIDIPA
ncbi:unnamed protein product [Adineta ricciae]|uniref:mitogen-activated protein kinase kinase n=1 Tax=Adineta ricciae TaxID=249248 RepID=A0A815PU84_ADIRI|nr:unnamed protein product [Adineta ricciae]